MSDQNEQVQQESPTPQPPQNSGRQLILSTAIAVAAIVWGVKNPAVAMRIIAVVLGFGGIIMIHEFGHFIVAKLGGIRVEAFSIGMGPVVMGIRKLKKGWRIRLLPKIGEEQVVEAGDNETEYQIAMLPIGGFVRMLGQSDTGAAEAGDDPRSYANRPVWIRICVVSAGVVFNAVGAMILFMALYMNGIDLPAGVVGHVAKNSPAYDAGIKAGDRIIGVNGDSFTMNGEQCVDFETIFQAALLSSGEPVSYLVARTDGTQEEIQLIPERPAGSEKSLLFSGISKANTLEVSPLIKDPNEIDKLYVYSGLRPGDIVKAVDGQAVPTPWDFEETLGRVFASEIELTVSRQWPPSDDPATARTMEAVTLPMVVAPMLDNFRDEFDLTHFCSMVPRLRVDGIAEPSKFKLLVNWIKRTIFRQEVTPVDETFLRVGDILVKVADVEYPNFKQLRDLTNEYKDKHLPLTVLRMNSAGVDEEVNLTVYPKNGVGSKRTTIGFGAGLDMESPVVAQVISAPGQGAILDIPAGATIVAVDGQPVSSFYEIAALLVKNKGQRVSIDYRHNNEAGGTAVEIPDFEPVHAQASLAAFIPFTEWTRNFEAATPLEAVRMGVRKVWQFIVGNYVTLGQLFKRDGIPMSALSGPVGIISMTYQVTEASVSRYLYFLGLISSCLAVMNLLPLPVLDGGHIVLLIIEKITGKPVHEKVLAPVMYIGLALILGLVLTITYFDVIRLLF
ncbi:MAG: site-2 protease family protein [Planctomycetota bacterium]|jgi:regulator of sigma E protease